MTEFKKATAEVERIANFVKQLEAGDLEIEFQMHGIAQVQQSAAELLPRMEKMKAKASEKDKDKQTYSEAMAQKVLELVTVFEELLPEIEKWNEKIEEDSRPYRTAKEQQELEQRKLEQHRRQQEEEERLRQQQEAEEVKRIAEEEARKVEEERRLEIERALERQRQIEAELFAQELQRRERLAAYLAANSPDEILLDSVKTLKAGTNSKQFEVVLRALQGCLANVVSYPDEDQFKRIRKANPSFHEEIAQYEGAVGVLFAFGFREDYPVGGETMLVLHEPDALSNYEEWTCWIAQCSDIKASVDRILDAISRSRYTHQPVDVEYVLRLRS
eukprot:TRINITY_DN72198_c0_g1_i1.p1 TRINITY_DN72198_c0_g1~~TRINITY_DN72198_c0_g1_i1.p1  ORF type:complete len:331 (+),score=93.42 TRINITY_DN72198_c0_g1_i1:28-1020(+)